MSSLAVARLQQSHNRLLAALPAAEMKRLLVNLEPVEFAPREIIAPAGDPLTHLYFIESGLVSVVQPLDDGSVVEVGLVGREGFVGLPLVLGTRTSPTEAIVQLKGRAMRIAAKQLREAAQSNRQFAAFLLSFVHAFHIQVAQTAACNARHALQQRLARWLLSAHDRCDGDELTLSHEFLSMMLGRRRAGVTVALGTMKRAGQIGTSRGRIQIIDRRGLEKIACECYRLVRNEYRQLLP